MESQLQHRYKVNPPEKILTGLNTTKIRSLNPAILSSGMMALAGMGDALLYAYLPVQGESLGMKAFIIGALLSVNKFIRFFTNRWIASWANLWGIKNILLLGVVLASITTISYAVNPAIWIWFVMRIIWGLAYSSLRFSCIQYAGITEKTGSALGFGRGIQELGPVIAYWIGPLIITSISAEMTFLIFGLAILLMLPTLSTLPDFRPENQVIKTFKLQMPKATDNWVFICAFITEGLMIVGISKIVSFNSSETTNLLIITALYISIRRVLNIIIAPVTGWLNDRLKFKYLFHFSCFLIVTGISFIALGYANLGIIITFFGSAMNTTLIPLIALKFTNNEQNFDAITTLSTSRDLGSAFGALIGLKLLSLVSVNIVFSLSALIIISIWYSLRKLG